MVKCVFGNPHGHVLVCTVDLPEMARQAFEVPVPMHRDKIRAAIPLAFGKEGLQPCEPPGTPRHSRRPELDTLFLQGLDDPHPCLRREFRVDVAAAVEDAVGLVEGQDVGDVGAVIDEVVDVVEEGVVGGGGWGAPEHRHELEFRAVGEGRRGSGAIVVVPC